VPNVNAGGLVGINYGAVSNSYATGDVQVSTGNQVGGLVGSNSSYGSHIITNSHATGSVSGTNEIGGLVGANYGSISNSYYVGAAVTGASYVGGLVGKNYPGSAITASYASTAAVSGTGNLPQDSGGLAGYNDGAISASYAAGAVSGGYNEGGLVGYNALAGSISNSHASSTVTGNSQVGGLAGANYGSVTMSHAMGMVSGSSDVGGLVGNNDGAGTATISVSYATGAVIGSGNVGGLVGMNTGSISTAFAEGNVTTASNSSGGFGGLVGLNFGAISNSYATGPVTALMDVGGLVGTNYGSVTNAYATGAVTGTSNVGGLVGSNYGSVSNTFYSISANAGLAGGLGQGASDSPGTVMGLTTAQLQTQSNFTSATAANGLANPGWDFGATWMLYAGHTAPLLQVFMTPLTVIGTYTQVYDGAAFAPSISHLSYSFVPDLSHLFGTVAVAGSASGSSNVGTYSFTPGGLYSDQLGYILSYNGGSLTITPATLTISGTQIGSKVYNGTTVATLSGGSLVGLVGGNTLMLTQAGNFASKNVGTGIAVSANDSIGGANADDYILVDPTGLVGNITPALLTVNGTVVGSKVYDGSTLASLTGGTLVGVIGGDSVNLNQSGMFASSGAGTGIAVTATDSISGASAGDYSIVEPTGLKGTILPATTGTPAGSNDLLLAALNARTQIVENFIYPQWGAEPQIINPSTTIAAVGTQADGSSAAATGSQQAIVINVSMTIGANGTLKIEQGGLRLPGTAAVGQ
jgi:hypothetical protein